MIKRSFLFLALGLFLSLSGRTASAEVLAGLNADQLADLDDGGLVVTKKDIEGGVWPELTVYTRVNAPVSDVLKVFHDYDHAQDYVPNLVSARVVGQPEPDVFDIEYTSRLPLLGTTSYETRNWYETTAGGVSVRWKLLKSAMADISDGSLRVEPYEGGSVMRYVNYVKPKSAIAIVAKGAALSEVKKTVTALKAQAEKVAGVF